jgi:hypothetical protein
MERSPGSNQDLKAGSRTCYNIHHDRMINLNLCLFLFDLNVIIGNDREKIMNHFSTLTYINIGKKLKNTIYFKFFVKIFLISSN